MKSFNFRTFVILSLFILPNTVFGADFVCELKLGTFNDPDLARTTKVIADYDFTSTRKRRLVTLLYHRPDAPQGNNWHRDEKSRDKYVKLLYVLIDTEKMSVVWKFQTPFRDRPTSAALDKNNPDIAYIEKRVERLYLTSTEAANTKPHRDFPGLFFDAVFEILQVGKFGPDEEVYTRDLFTSDKHVFWDITPDTLKVANGAHLTLIPIQKTARP